MARDLLAEIAAHRLREGREQKVLQPLVIGEGRLFDIGLQTQLRRREQDGQFGPGQSPALRRAAREGFAVRQPFGPPVEVAGFLQHFDHAQMAGRGMRRAALRDRQGKRLQTVVLQHDLGDLVGHLDQQGVAPFLRQTPGPARGGEGDLDIHLVIRTIDARRIVDEVGIDPPVVQSEFDPRGLRDAEVRALADHLHAQIAGADAQGVVGGIADLRIHLVAGLHISADAAEP